MDTENIPPLLALPPELIHHILSFLAPTSLASATATCRLLHTHAYSDALWQTFINSHLPSPLTTPYPLPTFRELYVAHHPYWFLPRHKLWFSDSEPSGKLLIARYDPRRGCIEAYAVVAERGFHTFELWSHDQSVAIHSFRPRVQLDLNQPVLKLNIGSPRTEVNVTPRNRHQYRSVFSRRSASNLSEGDEPEDEKPTSPLSREILMDCSAPAGLYTSFMLARDHPPAVTERGTAVWPPLRIPAPSRTRNASANTFHSSGHRPRRLEDVSQNTFRLRKWVEFSGRRNSSSLSHFASADRLSAALGLGFSRGGEATLGMGGGVSVRMGEEVSTFGTLLEKAYTPTPSKPWRGIWCGDYSGHGCEFLVILQPEEGEEEPLPTGMNWMRDWLATGRRGSTASTGSFGSGLLSAEREAMMEDVLEDHEDEDEEEEGETRPLEDWNPWPGPAGDSERGGEGSVARTGGAREYESGGEGSARGTSRAGNAGPQETLRGRLEAVKLTGDPNVPRGEYTFIAPELGDAGLVRVAQEEIFRGARVVRAAGHIAGRGFRNDEYMPSQLILISPDRIAQYWEGFGHIAFYQRVDLDCLMRL